MISPRYLGGLSLGLILVLPTYTTTILGCPCYKAPKYTPQRASNLALIDYPPRVLGARVQPSVRLEETPLRQRNRASRWLLLLDLLPATPTAGDGIPGDDVTMLLHNRGRKRPRAPQHTLSKHQCARQSEALMHPGCNINFSKAYRSTY
ncbi:hypothetical protein F4824DRAFT_394295 [Ustulina deusta]|nr:hypothetical protein F4824DRAFT_394295 [Ustulina deusta]